MKTVIIDAGHGGHDSGAVGSKSCEKDHALAIAKLVQKHLQDDVNVIMTRSTDVFIELTERSVISNNAHADAFVSIHMNSADNRSATGTEILYMNKKDLPLAEAVYPLLIKATGLSPRGIKYQNVSVVRKTNAPAILCEVAFVSNLSDEAKLLNNDYRNNVAKAIADGIRKFLGVQAQPTYQLLGSTGAYMDTLQVYNGTAYVNARKWESWFGVNVAWDEDARKALLNGKPVTTKLIDSVGCVAIREAAAAAGLKLDVDNAHRTITLKRN